jgi:hypothetical protein
LFALEEEKLLPRKNELHPLPRLSKRVRGEMNKNDQEQFLRLSQIQATDVQHAVSCIANSDFHTSLN